MRSIRWRPIAGGCSGLPSRSSAAASMRRMLGKGDPPLCRAQGVRIPRPPLTVVTLLCPTGSKLKASAQLYVAHAARAGVRCEGLAADAATEFGDDLSFAPAAGAGPAWPATGTRRLPASRRL